LSVLPSRGTARYGPVQADKGVLHDVFGRGTVANQDQRDPDQRDCMFPVQVRDEVASCIHVGRDAVPWGTPSAAAGLTGVPIPPLRGSPAGIASVIAASPSRLPASPSG
jgi:hypothetical protein